MDKNTHAGAHAHEDAEREFETLERRLNASREAIRRRLNPPESDASGASADETGSRASARGRSYSSSRSWSSLVFDLLAPAAKNAAARHPLALIVGSAAIGAYLVWARPWRGVLGSMLVGTVLRNIGTASVMAGSQGGSRILQHFLQRNKRTRAP